MFTKRLYESILSKRNPVLVGLDPRLDMLPESFGFISPDETEKIATAFSQFCREIIDVVAMLVPAVKPQVAFFEQYGPAGMSALKEIVDYAHQKQLLVILDGKRGDIGSTASAYADGLIGPGKMSIWGGDALTVNPYLGDDSLTPFVEVAEKRGGGIFVLVKTSNPGGAKFQDLIANGKPIYQHVAEYVQSLAVETAHANQYGSVGAVVGATWPRQMDELRAIMPNVWFLVPGFGAQGGSAKDVAGAFDSNGFGAIVNNSRGIIFAYRREQYANKNWQRSVEQATLDMIAQLRAETSVGQIAR